MPRKNEISVMKYYTIQPGEGAEEIMVVGTVDKHVNVLIHTFGNEGELFPLVIAQDD